MLYRKEVIKYIVVLEDFVSSIGGYRIHSTKDFLSECDAIKYAREHNGKFRVTVQVLETVSGWE